MSKENIPSRNEAAKEDTWDLSKLFVNDKEWEEGLEKFEKETEKIPSYKGTLGASGQNLAAWLDFYRNLSILEERLGCYAILRQTEDEGDSAARTMTGKFAMAAAKSHAASAWAAPEIMAIPDSDMKRFMSQPELLEYRIYLEKLLRQKPYILSEKEER